MEWLDKNSEVAIVMFPEKYSSGSHNKIWPHSIPTPLFSSEKAKTGFDFLNAKKKVLSNRTHSNRIYTRKIFWHIIANLHSAKTDVRGT